MIAAMVSVFFSGSVVNTIYRCHAWLGSVPAPTGLLDVAIVVCILLIDLTGIGIKLIPLNGVVSYKRKQLANETWISSLSFG
jgi:hypothetical protein